MPKITAIKPQKRKGRFNIYIDKEFAFGIDEDTLVQEGLIVGKEISELEISELEEKGEIGKLYQKALHFLEYRPRSEREVKDYLKRKLATPLRQGYGGQAAEDVEITVERIIKQLKSHNYLNDEEFARWWVEQRRNSRNPRGIRVIQSELYRKGISRKIVEEVINTENNEEGLALKAAQKQLNRLKKPKTSNSWELKRKLTAYLSRRGFEWDTIKTTVDALTSTLP